MNLNIFTDHGPAILWNGPQWHGGPELKGLPDPPAEPYRVRQVCTATGAYRTQISSCELFDLSEADRQALVRFFGEVNEVTDEVADSFEKISQEDQKRWGLSVAEPPESKKDELIRLRKELRQLREEKQEKLSQESAIRMAEADMLRLGDLDRMAGPEVNRTEPRMDPAGKAGMPYGDG
jgi:hypothetical protein